MEKKINKKDRIFELIDILNNASESYYQKDTSDISDKQYDTLYDELVILENETGIIMSNSPTQKVGFKVVSSLDKLAHSVPMLSLDKTKEVEKLISFLGKEKGILSWKLDGLTIALTYKEGRLIKAVTRGNGEVGEDVTHNVKVFKNVPLSISYKNELTVRGEAIITFSDFKKINESLDIDAKYKNPRNLTSGSVRQLSSEDAKKRKVMYYSFSVASDDNNESIFENSKESILIWLKSLGFTVVDYKIVNSENIQDVMIDFKNAIDKNDFATDGLVLTYDNINLSKSLGSTSKFPRDSLAFKWKDETAETVIKSIEWNTSRTGLINPVAVFEEVDLEGSTVSRASVHNVGILEDLKLGVGDTVVVYKANMIIPQISENITKSSNYTIPDKCPECGAPSELRQAKDQKALYCTNPNCKAQLVKSLTHFVSRDAMNIEGFSESTIEKFVDKEYLKNYTDIYTLNNYFDEIELIEGFGEKSVKKLDYSINKSKFVKLSNFIYALGINNIGLSNAKLLCKYYDYELVKIEKATVEELCEIEGFGEIIARSIVSYFSWNENLNLLNKIKEIITFDAPLSVNKTKSLEDITVVITGDLSVFLNRAQLQNKIEEAGGKVTGSITKKTNYLICNDPNSSSTKNKKANELNIPIITEEEFVNLFL